jgi:hypothetical protein
MALAIWDILLSSLGYVATVLRVLWAITRVILTPVFIILKPLELVVRFLLWPLRAIHSFEPLYGFLGTAAMIGLITGLVLGLFCSKIDLEFDFTKWAARLKDALIPSSLFLDSGSRPSSKGSGSSGQQNSTSSSDFSTSYAESLMEIIRSTRGRKARNTLIQEADVPETIHEDEDEQDHEREESSEESPLFRKESPPSILRMRRMREPPYTSFSNVLDY